MTIIKVVEPHAILRLGLLQLIANVVPDVKIEGADYGNLFDSSHDSRDIDLVLLSISPAEDTNHLIDAAMHAYAPRSIMLLSEHNQLPGSIALPPAVCGYVPKNADPEVLQAAIRLVLASGTCFPLRKQLAPEQKVRAAKRPETPCLPGKEDEPGQSKLSLQAHAESEMLGLTPRQYEVLVLLARGYPMKTVGRYLNISVATAKAHTETLYQRLDVHNRNAAVYAAVSRGAKLGWTCIGGQSECSGR
ncbi:response regulator transcription factor [Pusillimonas sp.]|uniref:response regulator transcription factor n=1 Tax=Pusillimonas sp. TaxID=3040095 RepID=UPI0029B1729A|nr:response regulator transcription factor [Pusillimonas sp.]MDX3893314.1 response regulator transcription factor [Pusillimonas sp.]